MLSSEKKEIELYLLRIRYAVLKLRHKPIECGNAILENTEKIQKILDKICVPIIQND